MFNSRFGNRGFLTFTHYKRVEGLDVQGVGSRTISYSEQSTLISATIHPLNAQELSLFSNKKEMAEARYKMFTALDFTISEGDVLSDEDYRQLLVLLVNKFKNGRGSRHQEIILRDFRQDITLVTV
jgi:hypothetical protein